MTKKFLKDLMTTGISLTLLKLHWRELLKKEEISFYPDALISLCLHWITPEFEKKRFSARFFLSEIAARSNACGRRDGTYGSFWITPQKALEMHRKQKIILMPPTFKTIEELSTFKDINELFSTAKTKIIYPILPQLTGNILRLPHDPEYSIDAYKRPVNLSEPSRILAENGVWKTAYYKEQP